MLGLVAVSGPREAPAMAIAMAVLGFSGALSNVQLDRYLFVHVSVDKQARVASIGMLLDYVACALGPAFGGVIAELLGPGEAVWLLFALTVPCVVFGLRYLHVPQTLVLPERAEPPARLRARSNDNLLSPRQGAVAHMDTATSTSAVN
jgi:predicted MFS family arabinose efflux permease